MKRLSIILCFIALIASSKAYSQDYSFKWSGLSARFLDGMENMVSYIDFGEAVIWGNVEISLTSDFNYQNSTGKYSKLYNIGRNPGNVIFSNTSEVLMAFGPVATQWKLGEFEVDGVGHLRIPIYHLVNSGNLIAVEIKGVSVTTVDASKIQLTVPQKLVNTQTRDYRFTLDPMAIGTNKIDLDAKLTIGGKVTAREIKVSIDAGADFVFEPDYKNMSLEELAVFLKQNKHLPGVPSASEMQKSGLEVGGFQIKLLQKIEELTLHMIEKDKELEKERAKNRLQEERINRLEELVKQIIEKNK